MLYELTEKEYPFGARPRFCRDIFTDDVQGDATFATSNYRSPVSDHVTDQLRDLFTRLFRFVPEHRLGGRGDHDEVKQHPFFENVDWELVDKARIDSPMPRPQHGQSIGNFKRDSEDKQEADVVRGVQAGNKMQQAEIAAAADPYSETIDNWEFVSPEAIAQEYVEQLASCISAV